MGQDRRQLLLQPAVQDGVGAGGDPLDPDLAVVGVNNVITLAVPLRKYSCGWRAGSPWGSQEVPGWGTVWERARLVGAPHRQTHRLAEGVGILDQFFFDEVLGSVTSTMPLFRLRSTVPVGHQERFFWGEAPASWSTRPMV